MKRIFDRLQDTPAEIVTELGETLRQTPLSVAMTGVRLAVATLCALLAAPPAFAQSEIALKEIARNREVPLLSKMIADGYTGRKGKGGFYRINREKGKLKEAIDLTTPQDATSRDDEVSPTASPISLTEGG